MVPSERGEVRFSSPVSPSPLFTRSIHPLTLRLYPRAPFACTSSPTNSPHMRKLYGDSLRKDAGFVKVIKKVASKNARLLERRAGRLGLGQIGQGPEMTRVVKVVREVRGNLEKVFEETAEVVEEFLAKCKFLFRLLRA